MQAADQSNERLHQQASAQYLQGNFEEALATWKQILANDPGDERASEGVRLCQLLTEDADAAAAAPANEPPAADAAPATTSDAPPIDVGETDVPAAEDAIEFKVPDLQIDLPQTQTPDPVRQSEGIDLGAEPEILELDGEIPQVPATEPSEETVEPQPATAALDPPAAASEATSESNAETAEPELGTIVDGILGDDTAPGLEETSAAELQKRVQDLVAEARAAYDGGDTLTAHSVLTRIFILDEKNADALQLQEQIEDGVPASTEHVDVADLDAPDYSAAPGESDLAADAPAEPAGADVVAPPAAGEQPETEPAADEGLQLEVLETAPEPTLDEALTSETLDDPAADELPEFDVDGEFEDQEESYDDEFETVEPAAGKIKLPQLAAGSSKTRWIVIGVAVGLFVVVGVGFWMKLRAIEIREVAPPIAQPVEAAAEPVNDPEAQAEAAQVEPEAAPQPNVAPTEDVATLLERANNAFEAGEYSQAILAFNAALKIQPDHFEANERMQAATERYREQQEIQQQWIAATSLFRDHEYRSAMQMFYRLPVNSEENRVRLERYTENGWYNMGLLALRSGQCDRARQHFEEAVQLDPEDADINMALALCETCEGGTRRSGFQRAVAAMPLRGLDD